MVLMLILEKLNVLNVNLLLKNKLGTIETKKLKRCMDWTPKHDKKKNG